MLVAGLDRGQLHEIFHALVLGRAADERLTALRTEGLVEGPAGSLVGREGGVVGSAFALRRRTDGTGDVVAPSAGATGAVFLLGGTPLEFFQRHLARAGGPLATGAANPGGSDLKRGILGAVSPPGIMLEVMAGITLAFRMRGEDRVGLVYGAPGDTATGAWHEGLNLAAVQRCPLIVLAERVDGDPSSGRRETRVKSFVDKAPGYGIAAKSVDGQDVLAVFDATRDAVARARAGQGVTLLELRYPGRPQGAAHHLDEGGAAPDPSVNGAAEGAIDRFRRHLVDERWATVGELDAVAERAEADVRAAAEQALDGPLPDGAEALRGVYTDVAMPRPWHRTPASTLQGG